jgi:hypothetical protein
VIDLTGRETAKIREVGHTGLILKYTFNFAAPAGQVLVCRWQQNAEGAGGQGQNVMDLPRAYSACGWRRG